MERRKRRAEGSVERMKRPDGTLYPGWYIRYTDATGKRRREKAGRTKTAANALLRKRLDEKDVANRTGKFPVELATFEQIEERLLAHWRARLAKTSIQGRNAIVRRAISHFGNKPISRVTRGEVTEWLTTLTLERKLAPATVRHYAAVLSSAFEYAIEIGHAETNPVRGVKLPAVDKKRVRYITDEQRRNLYAHMPESIRLCAMMMGDAGLRRGEALALTWDAFGPDFCNVTIARSKNHKPRVVPLLARTADALRAHQRRKTTPFAGPDRVFDVKPTDLNKLFRIGADRAGLEWMTPHVMRHCYASWHAQRGTPLTEIARLLGHADIQMAARYAQWAPNDSGLRAVARLEDDTRGHDRTSRAMGGN